MASKKTEKPPVVTEVEFRADEPTEPDWKLLYQDALDQHEASRVWRETCSELRKMNALTVANGPAIRRLVVFTMVYFAQEQIVAEKGALRFGKEDGEPYHSPHWTILKSADETIRQLESELCIAPMRRSRVGKVERKQRGPRASDAYLRPVKA